MFTRILFLTALLYASHTAIAHGQSSAVAQLYGEGVHRYFARDYTGAEQSLNRAVEAGSQDPRVFYYRGLARSAYGGASEMDYEEGARLEASGRVGVNVGLALTRIQGYERVKIEKARHDARLFAQQQRELMRQAEPAVPAPPVTQPAEPPAATDPFSGDGLRSNEVVEVVPAPTEQPAQQPEDDTAVDPFADEPAPATTEPSSGEANEGADPFSDPGTPAEPDAPAEVESSEDPFAG